MLIARQWTPYTIAKLFEHNGRFVNRQVVIHRRANGIVARHSRTNANRHHRIGRHFQLGALGMDWRITRCRTTFDINVRRFGNLAKRNNWRVTQAVNAPTERIFTTYRRTSGIGQRL